MTNPYIEIAKGLAAKAGQTLGVSKWFTVNKPESDAFRIAVRMPIDFAAYPTQSLLHAFHPLALISRFSTELGLMPLSDQHMISLNYGFDHAEWRRPLLVDERYRARLILLDVTQREGGHYLIRRRNLIEAESESEPVFWAISCSFWFLRQPAVNR